MLYKLFIVMILIGICIFILVLLGMYLWSEAKHYFHHQAPTISSYDSHYHVIKKYVTLGDNKTLIDLGCGTGSAMRFFRKYYQLAHIHGIDNNLVAVLYSRFLQKRYRYHNLNVLYGDIEMMDISSYDYIYLFLLPGHIDKLQPWLIENMKSEAIVISNTFSFSNWIPSAEFCDEKTGSMIRLYKK